MTGRVIRIAAAVSVITLTLGLWMALSAEDFQHAKGVEYRLRWPRRPPPILAMELARDMKDVEVVVGREVGGGDRELMAELQYTDFAFIVAYWAEFLLIGYLLSRRERFFNRVPVPAPKVLATAAGLFATAGAALDLVENRAILRVLKLTAEPRYDDLARQIYSAAMWKWGLLFVAMFLLSFVFIGRRDWASARGVLFMLPGLGFFLAAALGLYAVLMDKLLTVPFSAFLSLGLLTQPIALLLSPSKFEDGLDGNVIPDQPRYEQKVSSKQRATAQSKRRYIVPILFACVFIASTAILLVNVSGIFYRTSDVSSWVTIITAVVSAISAICTTTTTVLAVRRDRREARQFEREIAQAKETPVLPAPDEKPR